MEEAHDPVREAVEEEAAQLPREAVEEEAQLPREAVEEEAQLPREERAQVRKAEEEEAVYGETAAKRTLRALASRPRAP